MIEPAASQQQRPSAPGDQLRPRDRAILDLERSWHTHQGEKAEAIRAAFGISVARYHQVLARLIDEPAAAAYDPLVVARLRRRRDERQRRRTARALGRGEA